MSAPFYAACIAAPRSGEGKTMVAMSLMRLLTLRGFTVQGFKCGPDYIDPTFHGQACRRPSYNLDTWMMGPQGVRHAWVSRIDEAVDVALCEGVMGLFDGKALSAPPKSNASQAAPTLNLEGSTLDCARVIGMPIILVVNARGMATSIAALVEGFCTMAERHGAHIVGIIANNVGSSRHVDMLRMALERAQLPKLLGAIPRCADWALPERQLGLVPQGELDEKDLAWLDAMVEAMAPHIDVEALLHAIRMPRPQRAPSNQEALLNEEALSNNGVPTSAKPPNTKTKRMAIARDKAFCFYYDANLEALQSQGWELISFSPLADTALPSHIDALYLGGGYPEEYAADIAANAAMRQSIQDFAGQGGLVYAECGGYMTLGKKLIDIHGIEHEMYGLINATASMGARLRSLGYREFVLQAESPFAAKGTIIRGHEFHWSSMEHHEDYAPLYTFNGLGHGVAHGTILAGYGHLYWAHLPEKNQENQCSKKAQGDVATKRAHGKVLFFNGPSSAGKSTLVELVQKRMHLLGFPTLLLSMDSMLKATSAGHESARAAMQADNAVVQALHGAIAAASMAGTAILVDHVLSEEKAWHEDLVQRLDNTPLCIHVHCHLPELERRELQRNDRSPDLEHVRRQHACMVSQSQANAAEAICIDTSDTEPEHCADELMPHILSYFAQ